MAEITSLTRKRGLLKGRLTTFRNYIESMEGVELSEEQILEIEHRLGRAQQVLTEFDSCHDSIISIVDEENLADHEAQRSEFENIYFKSCSKAQCLIAKARATQNSNGSHSNYLHNSSEQLNKHDNIRLPALKLPEFDGSYNKWLAFHDTFKTVIHDNNSMSSVQKFHYLSSCLIGQALHVIEGLEISEANYEAAWQLLKKRYENKPLMIHNHIKGIVEFPKLTKHTSASLRNLQNTIQGHVRALQSLKQPVEKWDSLLNYLIADKLDPHTKAEWEKQQLEGDNGSSVQGMMEFLEKQCQLLEMVNKETRPLHSQSNRSLDLGKPQRFNKPTSLHVINTKSQCPLCENQHALFACKKFLDLPISTRITEVKRLKRCLNCLRAGHLSINCKSRTCSKCSKMHNTLLHLERQGNSSEQCPNKGEIGNQTETIAPQNVTTHVHSLSHVSQVLPTAVVQVQDKTGNFHDCTVLLDSGSQSNFLSAKMCRKLNLPITKINLNVSCINQAESTISEMTNAVIKSKCSDLKATLSFLLIPNITSNIPSEQLDMNKLHIPRDITLADPQFHQPKKIDMLIGVDLFWDLLCPSSTSHPFLHKTKLGYVVSGRVPKHEPSLGAKICNFSRTIDSIPGQLKKFWEIEECPKQEKYSLEELACESNFTQHTQRDSDGRFIVAIPLKGSLELLGDSKKQAEHRLELLERKFQRDETLRTKYIEFMEQYQQLGHMSQIDDAMVPECSFYLPHHGVIKEESLTTKLRVVFDGSASSSTGVSVNDLHMIGPTLQQDLQSILFRFRQYPFVVGADISMMYRQVLVHPQHRALQQILWRSDPTQPIQTFQLNTVTYGLASSSFLAIRCLFQLAKDCEQSLPHIARIIRENMYVDDLLYGSNTVEEAVKIHRQITEILNSGKFPLRKWISNDPQILEQIEEADRDLTHQVIRLGENEIAKTLGLSWRCTSDELIYNISEKVDKNTCSKRSILSTIARIYDPLGLLSPCVIKAKLILQKLWILKSSWDEPLPSELCKEWEVFVKDLMLTRQLSVPRQVCCALPARVEIHAFSDASEVAYGACIYLRSIDPLGNIHVNLLSAKSKVAPLKSLTIPRLELCAAQISARLAAKIKNSLDIPCKGFFYWSDSTIALCWIKTEPYALKTFVSNRVSDIRSTTNPEDWYHVASQENPADLISRGMSLAALQKSHIWWRGPPWLSSSEFALQSVDVTPNMPELKVSVQAYPSVRTSPKLIWFEQHSDLNKLERVLAYCLRFINNSRKQKCDRQLDFLTKKEIDTASRHLARISQEECFPEEIQALSKSKNVQRKSKLLSLSPFLDSDGILRVGGRLENSDYSFDQCHPIILSSHHPLTKLIFEREHRRLLHVGPQGLLGAIRQQYWPISGRSLSRKVVHGCVLCFRAKPVSYVPLMGHLPHERVTPAPAFYTTGVDYAGPFFIKDRKGRGGKISKCYVALFICFVTRAIHLELVTDLTSECFILALRRFASRWGMPSTLHSDNGTNFVGASSELKELGKFLLENQNNLNSHFIKERFNWKFIPAYSPHFGGIWEAGVKSVKHHLRRVMGNTTFTFEELYSLLAQISAILNSRPLTPLSPSPTDLNPLTPGHFLIGRPMTSVPDPDVTHIAQSHLSRYQHIQKLQQDFWKRWSKEYISQLQCRTKWNTNHQSPQLGALVVMKDDNSPPMKWQLGRIVALHPGPDSIVRVVSVRTSNAVVKRALARICPLPLEDPSN